MILIAWALLTGAATLAYAEEKGWISRRFGEPLAHVMGLYLGFALVRAAATCYHLPEDGTPRFVKFVFWPLLGGL
jgi:hypothetical protein